MEPKIVSSESTPAPSDERERTWLPLAIAAGLILPVVAAGLMMSGHTKKSAGYNASSTAPDPYASNLVLTNLAMSESSNLAGGKVTYLDGHITNQGNRTVTGVVVQAVFRDYANKVAQSETLPLTLIRMREPYIDTEAIAAAPLKPGSQQDFRLNFDVVTPDWAGAIPELRVVHVDTK